MQKGRCTPRLPSCKVLPSSFAFECDDDGPLSVLANGSLFLFLLGSERVVRAMLLQKRYCFVGVCSTVCDVFCRSL